MQVKKKMSLDDFVRNNRGINDGKDLSREFLAEIYSSINALEIKMSDEAGIDELTDMIWDDLLRRANLLHRVEDEREEGEGSQRKLLTEEIR